MSLLARIESHMPELLALLEACVNMDSPSKSKAHNDRMAEWFAATAERLLPAKATRLPHPEAGDRLLIEAGTGSRRILLVGHYDTVWPEGEAARRPFAIRDGRAYGPGVYDMKAGVLQALYAMKALQDSGAWPADTRALLFLNSDEEIGSPASRGLIEDLSRGADAALVLEPPMAPMGALKTARKGSGRYRLEVRGVSAHAGVAPDRGVSAIHELALQIQRLHAMSDASVGTNVNVGIVRGGIGTNVVADFAEAEIDVRVPTTAEAERVHTALLGLKPHHPLAQVAVSGRMMRPPMERTAESGRLFELARAIAREELGFELGEAATGGVSDGNFTAACGVPTLDGLGASGDFAHAPGEYVNVAEIPLRTALLTLLLARI
ncbi:M20 family metallopeptidase [Paenibacillus doosanensis]|uniref:M20 family metallopeptidase n=1 Tax=Paenibacillus doosanensis TaxID=1229154 RepID=UPI002180368D|nr:M20 family metallopeptidase [Paenibacillus doosanensis]MCS7464185.1 M20 family metallopeptidase [Paenibacillus doosanensis]